MELDLEQFVLNLMPPALIVLLNSHQCCSVYHLTFKQPFLRPKLQTILDREKETERERQRQREGDSQRQNLWNELFTILGRGTGGYDHPEQKNNSRKLL